MPERPDETGTEAGETGEAGKRNEPHTERLAIQGRSGKRIDPTLELPLAERITPRNALDAQPGEGQRQAEEPGPPPPPVDPWADSAPPLLPPPVAPPPTTPPLPPPVAPPPTAPPPATVPPVGPYLPAIRTPRGPGGILPPTAPPAAPRAPIPRTPPAPGWQPPRTLARPPELVIPHGYELRRRRRRWPRRLAFLLLSIGCCCGCPAYFLAPMSAQYPATAAIPAEAVGLRLREDAASRRAVRDLEGKARSRHWLAEDVFAAVYDGGPGWRVTVYGTTGFRLAPEHDLASEMSLLTEEYRLTDVREVDAGELGGYQRCGSGTTDGEDPDLVLCAWADHGSLGVATFSAGSLEKSAETLRQLRAGIVTRQ